MICIRFDSKFYSDSNDVNIKVIERVKKGHSGVKNVHSEVKNLKHDQIYKTSILNDRLFNFSLKIKLRNNKQLKYH